MRENNSNGNYWLKSSTTISLLCTAYFITCLLDQIYKDRSKRGTGGQFSSKSAWRHSWMIPNSIKINFELHSKVLCINDWVMLYISTRAWVLYTPNVGWNIPFQCFCAKSWKNKKRARKLMQNLAKKKFFCLHQNACWVLYSQKNKCFQW